MIFLYFFLREIFLKYKKGKQKFCQFFSQFFNIYVLIPGKPSYPFEILKSFDICDVMQKRNFKKNYPKMLPSKKKKCVVTHLMFLFKCTSFIIFKNAATQKKINKILQKISASVAYL